MNNIITQQDASEIISNLIKDYEYYSTDTDVSCNSTYILLTKKKDYKQVYTVGCVGIEKNTIKHLRVKKEFRKSSFGTMLLKKAEKLIIKRGYSHAIVYIHQNNKPAAKFFKKNGYKALTYNRYCFILRKGLNSC